jgi:hypothetical protein
VEGDGPYARGDYAMTYHVVEGASIDAERKLRPSCAGPGGGHAERLPAPRAQAWAIHDGIDGVLAVIERKLGKRREP